MARIVLATFGSLGDLHPVLAIAVELRNRGHAVGIATSEIYREKISGRGFAFAPLRPEVSVTDGVTVRRIMDPDRGSEFLLRDVMLPAVPAMLDDLRRATAGADLLVTNELVYAAPLLAEQTGLRWASYSLAPLSYFSIHDPCLPPVSSAGEWMHRLPPIAVQGLNGLAKLSTYSWWRPVRTLRRELGLPPGDNPVIGRGKHSPRLDLALFSSVIQAPQPDWPTSTVQTGFCFYDETSTLPPEVEQFLAEGEPPIVFTLGSAAVFAAENFYAESARAAQQLNRRAILLLGQNPPPSDLPSSILAWDYLPYALIFPHAAAVVHQGGVGTTAQALRAGRPMVIMPFAHDQPDNAARITRLGAGHTIARKQYKARTAVRALTALLQDPSYSTTAANFATRIRTEDGPATAADALERALG